MTTIAYKDGVLACDSLVTGNGGASGAAVKIIKLPDGSLFAGAGDLAQTQLFMQWVAQGMRKDRIKEELEALSTPDYTCVIIKRTGVVQEYNNSTIPCTYKAGMYAWGSGYQYALGCMLQGGTAVQAVKVAAKLDLGTGGRIRQLYLTEE